MVYRILFDPKLQILRSALNIYLLFFLQPIVFKGYKLEKSKSSVKSGLDQSNLEKSRSCNKSSATSHLSMRSLAESIDEVTCDTMWVNALLGRVLFDCVRDDNFTMRVKERIQRKLTAIKLPYFIEELIITQLSVGNTSPIIHEASLPVLDSRGLWVDFEMTYEGSFVLILQTKLNLMKLKHQNLDGKCDLNL